LSNREAFDTNSYSDQLLRLVQVVFAVVLGGGLIEFNEILFPPQFSSIAFWALIGVYTTSIMSWTGYHKRATEYNYTHTRFGILRLCSDILIVIMYAFLMFIGTKQHQPIECYLWIFSVVFTLYIISGWLRRKEHNDKKASSIKKLIYFWIASMVVSVLFTILFRCTSISVCILNWSFLFIPILLMIAFRYTHEWRDLKWGT
jgi:hypothetical protein